MDLEIGDEQFLAAQKREESQKKKEDNAAASSSTGPTKEKGKKATLVARFLKSISIHNAKMIIGNICNVITADPEKSLRKHRTDESNNDDDPPEYKMSDLLSILQHPNLQVLELAMLSCVLVFKDIIPGYRIRALTAAEKDAQVKKETKRLRDYENAILGAYQQFLNILHKMVADGLKNPKKVLPEWDSAAKLGLSALRCQCELLRAAPHFNCRAALLASIVTRAAQPDEEINRVCCGALEVLFKHDTEGEASFEAVRLVGKVLAACKYDVPTGIIQVLSVVKLRVHADEAKKVRRKAKSDRRKKRKDGDDVEAALMEADANPERSHALRFQADSLQELCLIYFRIIKMKVGFQLLPVALEGLGKISHLINIDTVADLVTLMATVLQTTSTHSMPIVQLHCIHCALRTLSGPGQELQMDEEVFVSALRALIKDLPARFDRWDVVLDCLDFALSKRRESRSSVVVGFVKLLFLHASHVMSDGLGLALLSMANTLLLKYPRVRSELLAIAMASASAAAGAAVGAAADTRAMKLLQEDDEVCDLAMRALRGSESQQEDEGDGSWLLALLKNHADKRYNRTVLALSAKEVATVPLRLSEARGAEDDRVMARIESVFNSIPSTLTGGKAGGKSNKGANKPAAASSASKKMTKMQEKNARRKARKNTDGEGAVRVKNDGSMGTPTSSVDSFLYAVNQRLRQAKRPATASVSVSASASVSVSGSASGSGPSAKRQKAAR
jgi:hypothetical protein